MISVRDLHKRFGRQIVLDGIDLDIEEGKTTTVVGPSGVGKSVLLKIIMGILKPEKGEVRINGRSMTAAKSESEKNEIRSSLGVLFQAAALFDSLTVYDNIAFPLRERGSHSEAEIRKKALEMIEALSLEPYVLKYPEEISMGIRKRVGMARALMTNPSILLFDEPNTGLDPLVGQEVYDLIKETRARWGFTGIVISHELPEVFQVSDKVVMLLNGKIEMQGTPEEFISSDNPAVIQFLNGKIDGPIKIQ
ncbi:MAG: ATP-binding cassette domain-containing protein [Candidatus Dadabacteria bacterium]|nr:MAG: ATP-binding cassette domain-containing protein [Candidatus Dadabacteria bacterium]